MPRNARSRHSTDSRPSFNRFGFALAVSALAHGLLLSAPPRGLPWRGWVSYPATAPMTVRLQPLPVQVPVVAIIPAQDSRRALSATRRPTERAKRPADGESTYGAPQPASEAPELSFAPDTRYYPVRELDTYPWPLAPLELDRIAGEPGGEVRLEMLIDERGIVQEIVFVQHARSGQAEEALRAALAATHFMPGRKDGRAVKSRLTLRLDLAPVDGVR